jgi:hypothetical protein
VTAPEVFCQDAVTPDRELDVGAGYAGIVQREIGGAASTYRNRALNAEDLRNGIQRPRMDDDYTGP